MSGWKLRQDLTCEEEEEQEQSERILYQYDELSLRSRFSNFEKKNPKPSLIYLEEFVICLQAQVVVDNVATLSFINEKFAQKLLLKYTLRKFMITLDYDAENTYDILLVIDFMYETCVNSGFYRTQEGPSKGIEFDGSQFIDDPLFYIGYYSEIESILDIRT